MSGRKVSVVLSHLDSLHVSLMLQHSASPLCSGRSSRYCSYCMCLVYRDDIWFFISVTQVYPASFKSLFIGAVAIPAFPSLFQKQLVTEDCTDQRKTASERVQTL